MVLGLGYSSIYNHSPSPNIQWESDEVNRLLVFSTIRDVEEGEELCSYYGDEYNWESVGYIEKKGQDGESENTDIGITPQGNTEEEKKRSSCQDQIFEI
jgi:SET domain-containing protein